MNIFDEIGVLPERRGKGDPMIIGSIVYRHGVQRRVSFVIAWWLRESDLTI